MIPKPVKTVIITVNNGDSEVSMNLQAGNSSEYVGALSGESVVVNDGRIQVKVAPNSGEIWIPAEMYQDSFAPMKIVEVPRAVEVENVQVKEVETGNKIEVVKTKHTENVTNVKETIEDIVKPSEKASAEPKETEKVVVDWNKSYEDMSVEELQEAILEKMRKNGPVTDYMLGTVRDNTHHDSLVNWVKSFR